MNTKSFFTSLRWHDWLLLPIVAFIIIADILNYNVDMLILFCIGYLLLMTVYHLYRIIQQGGKLEFFFKKYIFSAMFFCSIVWFWIYMKNDSIGLMALLVSALSLNAWIFMVQKSLSNRNENLLSS